MQKIASAEKSQKCLSKCVQNILLPQSWKKVNNLVCNSLRGGERENTDMAKADGNKITEEHSSPHPLLGDIR